MSKVVFVGNIPYDMSETQIVDIMKSVGSVASFRLVFEKETGRPKGFGFCTYQDADTAASAVRNLNNYDIGGRSLRVDFAETELNEANANKPATNVLESISSTVSALPPAQIAELMSYIKLMIHNNAEQCRSLLIQNPQLSYAIFQALLTMNVVDSFSMQRILSLSGQPAPTAGQPPPQLESMLAEQQKQLLQQGKMIFIVVIAMSPEQIAALPVDQQQQILALRQQLMG